MSSKNTSYLALMRMCVRIALVGASTKRLLVALPLYAQCRRFAIYYITMQLVLGGWSIYAAYSIIITDYSLLSYSSLQLSLMLSTTYLVAVIDQGVSRKGRYNQITCIYNYILCLTR